MLLTFSMTRDNKYYHQFSFGSTDTMQTRKLEKLQCNGKINRTKKILHDSSSQMGTRSIAHIKGKKGINMYKAD